MSDLEDPILACDNVSIRYMTGDFKSIGLKEWVMRRLTGNYKVKEFWADRDITFSLDRGDMLGIIGTNGAGKSTLLKAISGIMEPTRGKVTRHGKIAALLELASGFDGDLTVKENAYLRGAMLGYTRAFMDETYKYIIEFSELKEFEDRPFKQLSSGMKSRLAFSIASLVKPEILILDEVLSVGDGAFRAKSEAKMKEIIKSGATTILVSHSTAQVKALCNKVLWLHRGEMIAFAGDVSGVCDCYEDFLKGRGKPRYMVQNSTKDAVSRQVARSVGEVDLFNVDHKIGDKVSHRRGTGDLEFVSAFFYDLHGQRITEATVGQTVRYVMSFTARKDIPKGAVIGLGCRTKNGVNVIGLNLSTLGTSLPELIKGAQCVLTWEMRLPLAPGTYHWSAGAIRNADSQEYYDLCLGVCDLKIKAHNGSRTEVRQFGLVSMVPGQVWLKHGNVTMPMYSGAAT